MAERYSLSQSERCFYKLDSALQNSIIRSFETQVKHSDTNTYYQQKHDSDQGDDLNDDIFIENMQIYLPKSLVRTNSELFDSNEKVDSHVPYNSRFQINKDWVFIDKCQYLNNNATLKTKVIFPSIKIAGKLKYYNEHQECNMIINLKNSAIEFVTVPTSMFLKKQINHQPYHFHSNQPTKLSGSITPTVRTDSYFAEQGFLSVYAFNCYGMNSAHHPYHNREVREGRQKLLAEEELSSMNLLKSLDEFSFDFNSIYDNDNLKASKYGVANDPIDYQNNAYYQYYDDNMLNYDKFIQNGVNKLLIKYMKKILQPAIKETLMDNMGYKVSYG